MENEMDNGAYKEENKCYCREGYCLPPGLVDVTACYYGRLNYFTKCLLFLPLLLPS